MVDIHTHILPGVDDGAKSLEMSLTMIRQEYQQGIKTIIVTPHGIKHRKYYKNPTELQRAFLLLQKHVTEVELILGSEIFVTEHFFQDLEKGSFLTFNHSKVVLIEFPILEEPEDFLEIFYKLKVRGYQAILAHPERYKYMDETMLRNIKAHGALIQINSHSFFGSHGKAALKKAKLFMEKELVDFIASDCHNDMDREPNLLKTRKYIEKKYGMEVAKKIFDDNPEQLLQMIR